MRIDFTTFGVQPPDQGKAGRAGPPIGDSGSGPSNPASGVDQTRFSLDPTRVQSLQAQVLAQPEIRAAKVQSLQQAIGNGEYSVSASHVADALIGELGGARG